MRLTEFRLLLASNLLKRRYDLMVTSLDTHEYYETDDKRIIAFLPSTPKHIQVFDNEDSFLKIVARANQREYDKHILESYLVQLSNMPIAIDNAHKDLQTLLALAGEQLNYTFESFRLIDSALRRKVDFEGFLSHLYFPLMLYTGETICRQRKGHWHVLDTPYAKEPYVILPNGSKINVFAAIYSEAVESFDTFSVSDTIDLLLFDGRISS